MTSTTEIATCATRNAAPKRERLRNAVRTPDSFIGAVVGEFFGGLGLIFGFLSRFSVASIILIMLGAIGMVHSQFGFFMNWTGKQVGEGFEYHLLAIGTLLPILIAGPGRFAIGLYLPLPKIARADRVVTVLE